jgi:MFS transporter, ACS family, tartrate transporter
MHMIGESQVIAKVFYRLMPFCMLLYVISAVDRTNVGFAALQMNHDLALTAETFGLGAGIFFLGYCAFEIPSNLILARVGARRWIARILITWGIVVMAMAGIQGRVSFYILRFLLGLAEAGLLPGLLFYLARWMPRSQMAKTVAVLLCGSTVANIIAGPLATGIMSLDGAFGLSGWRLMFIVEGIPAVIIGFVTLRFLTETPAQATWLTNEERAVLSAALESDTANSAATASRFIDVLRSVPVWTLIGFCFFMQVANYGIILWLPQIIRSFGKMSTLQVGLLSSLPYIFASIAMILWGRRSDRTGERKLHLAGAVLLGAVGLAISALFANPVYAYVGLCVSAVGVSSSFGPFWAFPREILRDTAAAGGLAFINSVGLLGGFAGPYVVGFVRDRSGSFPIALMVLASSAVVAAGFAATLKAARATQSA